VGYLKAYEFIMQGFGVLLLKNILPSGPKSTITLGACYFNSPATKSIFLKSDIAFSCILLVEYLVSYVTQLLYSTIVLIPPLHENIIENDYP